MHFRFIVLYLDEFYLNFKFANVLYISSQPIELNNSLFIYEIAILFSLFFNTEFLSNFLLSSCKKNKH